MIVGGFYPGSYFLETILSQVVPGVLNGTGRTRAVGGTGGVTRATGGSAGRTKVADTKAGRTLAQGSSGITRAEE